MDIGPTYVQRIGHDGRPIEAPRLGSWHKPPPPRNVTQEGIDAVAAALGMERVALEEEPQLPRARRQHWAGRSGPS